MFARHASWFGGSLVALLVLMVGGCGGSETSSEPSAPTVVRNQPAPGLPYLLYTSDRDGDEEVYGVRADGKRTVQITRDQADIDGVSISPSWQWLTVFARGGRASLVSTNGRQRHPLAVLYIWGSAFSTDGKVFAYSEDPDSMFEERPPRVLIAKTATGRSRVLGRGEVWSISPSRGLLATFDGDVDLPDQSFARLTFFDAATGRTVRALDVAWPDYAPMCDVGWSPDGSSLAYLNGRTLELVDVTRDAWESRSVLRDRRLDENTCYGDMPVTWLDDEKLALWLAPGEYGELSVVTRDGDRTVLADDTLTFPQPVWTPDGRRVAYAVKRGENRVELVSTTASGTDSRVVFHGADLAGVAWAAEDRLLVEYGKAGRSVIALVDLEGRAERVFTTRGYPHFGALSPDGRFLSLGNDIPADESSRAEPHALGILSLARGTVARIPVTGNVEIIGWADSSAGEAGTASTAPSVELASRSHMRSAGEIAEISASGTRVAAIVEPGKLDCYHVVAWKAGAASVLRFAEPRPCSGDEEELIGIALEGTKLTWTGESWGNYAYLTCYTADVLDPQAGIEGSGGDEGYESGLDRPRPERATRRGVSARVEDGGVVLSRASDGRSVRLLAAGPVVDAELENEGLFYAYNTSGRMQGHIIFVPFAKLFD